MISVIKPQKNLIIDIKKIAVLIIDTRIIDWILMADVIKLAQKYNCKIKYHLGGTK